MSDYVKQEIVPEEVIIKEEIPVEQSYDLDVAINNEEQIEQQGLCPENFLIKHSETQEAENAFKCGVCGKGLSTLSNLKCHMTIHSDERNYKCDECDKSFKTKNILGAHKTGVHGTERNYKCDQCDKTFKVNTSRLRHIREVHATVRNYKCDKCDKVFKAKDHLRRHKVKVLVNERIYKCDQCDKTFRIEHNLEAHKLVLHTEGGFQCELCSQSFASYKYLRNHTIAHAKGNSSRFCCEECGKRFVTPSGLKSHMFTHSCVKNFICDLCDRKFRHKKNLVLHKRNEHAVSDRVENEKGIDEVKVEPTILNYSESKREVIKEEIEELDQSVADMEVKTEPVDMEDGCFV